DGRIEIWNSGASQPIVQTTGYAAYSVMWSPDGTSLAAGKTTDNVDILDSTTLKSTSTFVGHQDDVREGAWNIVGEILASGSDDQTVRLWQVKTGKCVLTIQTDSEVTSLEFSPNGKMLAAGLFSGKLMIWNVPDGSLRTTISSGIGIYG